MVERSIAWLIGGKGRCRKLRYRGVATNDCWLHTRMAALNLRRLINLTCRPDPVWAACACGIGPGGLRRGRFGGEAEGSVSRSRGARVAALAVGAHCVRVKALADPGRSADRRVALPTCR